MFETLAPFYAMLSVKWKRPSGLGQALAYAMYIMHACMHVLFRSSNFGLTLTYKVKSDLKVHVHISE